MKEYFINLWAALTNRNPYQKKLAELNNKLEEAFKNIGDCKEYYNQALQRWENSEKKLRQFEKVVARQNKEISSYQKLVENLRERIKEDYQKRIEDYNKEIEELRNRK